VAQRDEIAQIVSRGAFQKTLLMHPVIVKHFRQVFITLSQAKVTTRFGVVCAWQ